MMTKDEFKQKLLELAQDKGKFEVSSTCAEALYEQIEAASDKFVSTIQSLFTTYELEFRLSDYGIVLGIASRHKNGIAPDSMVVIGNPEAVKLIVNNVNKATSE